ncbi:M48 family metallopeptidase [Vitiosangium sp. GDMCC 1.1324]|uniref:tetratricopeptide repeat protein n=1 Tax=Vitiosangium sp. (strain GDMCC 1.1324) TaxID=2138576 RepID=UPI000D348CFC|nr:hypothetical protein [Vitiosangium sp. GDMCC 1.1324]PTL83965.1 hypothetical protein DAT35_10930 [Vitiosangium sp. GDMCC 1.1324]
MKWSLPALKSPELLALGGICLSILGALLCAAALLEFLLRCLWFQYYRLGFRLMRGGWLQRAEEIFQRGARLSSGTHRTAALAGLAACRMHQGHYAEAVAMLEPLMDQRLPRWLRRDEVVLRGLLALCLAMQGDTLRAKRWLDEACARFGGMVTYLVLPEVAILCREGRLGAALKRMEDCWQLLVKDGVAGRRLRLFRAYAQRGVDPERNADLVAMALLSLAPFPKEELAFCREHWPVLADFMQLGEDLVARREEERAGSQAERSAALEAASASKVDTSG